MPAEAEDIVQEQALKIKRYEAKLKDIVSAFKSLQEERNALKIQLETFTNESNSKKALQFDARQQQLDISNSKQISASNYQLQGAFDEVSDKLEEAEHELASLRQELTHQTKEASEFRRKFEEKVEKIEALELAVEEYQQRYSYSSQKNKRLEEVESTLNERVSRLTRDLLVAREGVENAEYALAEAQQQHEISISNFETRLSALTSTLKLYEMKLEANSELIVQLRSQKEGDIRDSSKLKCLVCNPQHISSVEEFLDLAGPIWRRLVTETQQEETDDSSAAYHQYAEELLLDRFGFRVGCRSSSVSHAACEEERENILRQLTETNARLMNLHDSIQNHSPSQLASKALQSPGLLNKSESSELSEEDHVKLLRTQNIGLLSEYESLRKYFHTRLSAANAEANLKLSECASRYESQIARLESKLCSYRERTLSLLADRGEEIAELRARLFLSSRSCDVGVSGEGHNRSHHTVLPPSPLISLSGSCNNQELPDYKQTDAVEGQAHCGLIHCAERYGRLMIELRRLRQAKSELENNYSSREAEYREEKEALLAIGRERQRTTIAPFPTNCSSSTSGVGMDICMTYVRNVILNLLVSPNSITGRQAMVKALAMALNFSSDEESAMMLNLAT